MGACGVVKAGWVQKRILHFDGHIRKKGFVCTQKSTRWRFKSQLNGVKLPNSKVKSMRVKSQLNGSSSGEVFAYVGSVQDLKDLKVHSAVLST
jgi:hypothetical protein